ncbi:MAG: hypothetical protein Q9216_001986 [Gyalolechia sp. 2 TL-2023]
MVGSFKPTWHPTTHRHWEEQRSLIQQLYVTEDKSLPQVVDEIQRISGFTATERQYKRRISEWRLDKNVKEDEMRAIIAMQSWRLRQGKASKFYVRGREVDALKIKRFARRKEVAVALPPDVRCITPATDGLIAEISAAQGPERNKSSSRDIMIPPVQAQRASRRRDLEGRLDRFAKVVNPTSVSALSELGTVSAATPNNKRSRTSRFAEASTASNGSTKDTGAIAHPFTPSDTGRPRLLQRPRLDTPHDNDQTTTTIVNDGKHMRSQEGSVLPSNNPTDPSSRYSPFRGRQSSPGSKGLDSVITSPRTNTNLAAKVKSLEAPEPQNNSIFRERLQAAQNMHIISQSSSPAPRDESEPSPFRPESPIAWDLFPYQTTKSNNEPDSAAQPRDRQKSDADQVALAQHSRRADYFDIPRTISPKESMLDYDPAEDEAQAPLFSQLPRDDRRYLTSEETPEFPAYLTSMGTSKSQPENSVWLHSLPAAKSTRGSRLSETHDVSGSYICTHQGCTAAFKSAAQLQRHRREDHQGMSPRSPIAASATSFSTNPNPVGTPSRVGPQKCQRINPSTGKPCNTVFSRWYDLTRHEDTIHNSRKQKVRCHLCTEEKTFARNDALTRHMRVVHPDGDWPGKTKRLGVHQVPNHIERTDLKALLNESHDKYEMRGQEPSTSERTSCDKIPEFPANLTSMEASATETAVTGHSHSPRLDRTMADIYQDELYSPRVP